MVLLLRLVSSSLTRHTFRYLPPTRWTEVYECAVHVGRRHLGLSTRQSGQASSILVSSEWQIGCHKAGLIAVCCSLRRSLQAEGGMETKPCRQRVRYAPGFIHLFPMIARQGLNKTHCIQMKHACPITEPWNWLT